MARLSADSMPSRQAEFLWVSSKKPTTSKSLHLPTFVGLAGVARSLYCSLESQFAAYEVDPGQPVRGTSSPMKIRYSERVATEFPVIFAGDSFVGEGTVHNVSVPGCAIVSNRAVEPGTYLEMKVLMPDSGPSLCVELAKIRWRKGRCFGVEFIRMPGADQVRLGRLIRRHREVKSAARLQHARVLHFP